MLGVLHPWHVSLQAKTEQLCTLRIKQSKAFVCLFSGVFPTHRASGVMVSSVLCSWQERGKRGSIEVEL